MSDTVNRPIHIIGGGLAGSEAAWQIVQAGIPVVLYEMRPVQGTAAHLTDGLAELVCSNSFRLDDAEYNAVGLLHEEMRQCNSLIIACGDRNRVPAGSALAVDRLGFSAGVTEALTANDLVTIERGEIAGLPPADWDQVIVATGPLTCLAPSLSAGILDITGQDSLAFFDAIAPIVHKESSPRVPSPRRRPASSGQCSWHALQHGGLPNEVEIQQANSHFSHDPWVGTG